MKKHAMWLDEVPFKSIDYHNKTTVLITRFTSKTTVMECHLDLASDNGDVITLFLQVLTHQLLLF